jgi:hypothetical protein
MSPKAPSGPPMTLGNMRELGVQRKHEEKIDAGSRNLALHRIIAK